MTTPRVEVRNHAPAGLPAALRFLSRYFALVSAWVLFTGCASKSPPNPPPPLARFDFSRPQMGVPFRLVLYDSSETNAQAAAAAAYTRVTQLNAILSDYDPESELNQVCHQTPVGQPAPISAELGYMLERSLDLSRRSEGAFDVTMGPVINLWRRSRRRLELPPPDLLAEALSRVGWRYIQLSSRPRTVTFLRPSMRLDFGGIAKGYAADEALRIARTFGITHALAAAAGDVTVGEPPPNQPGWRIEIGQLDLTNAPPSRIVWLRNASVSTSGDLFQRLEIGGRRYSHIVDPRTGIGLTDHSLVTVIAPDGTTADSLATAVSVLGPEKGLALVERTRNTAALILRAPTSGTIESHESRRLARYTRSASP